jgi:Tfp pilus assembly protein PilF
VSSGRKSAEEPQTSVESISQPQQAAAGVFSAKQPAPAQRDNKKLLLIGAAVLLLVLLIGMQVYSYLDALNQPVIVVPRPPLEQQQPAEATVVESQVTMEADGTPSAPIDEHPTPAANSAATSSSSENVHPVLAEIAPPTKKQTQSEPRSSPARSEEVVMGAPVAQPEESGLKVTRNPVEVGVNPDLVAGYQAFNAGEDAKAQYHYRKVLQSDIRNTDALLGMAGIASRQGRNQDAAGWYAKVLEVDPRNTVAQAALASGFAEVDPIAAESRIKNLLALKPEAAHLYAALGNLYAERRDWTQAQQAYFQAYHFAPGNADYAFNLAISLDHLGKPALALQYYKQAQQLLSQSGSGNIDPAQLALRIQQLQ